MLAGPPDGVHMPGVVAQQSTSLMNRRAATGTGKVSARPARDRGNYRRIRQPMLRFFVLFILIQGLLFGLELTPWAQHWFVMPWTDTLARTSAGMVKLFDPSVLAQGNVLQSTRNGFAVSIEAGCNGIEATIVLLAAI